MLDSSAEYAAAQAQGLPAATYVDAYYDGQLRLSGIPVSGGELTDDETQDVARDVSLSVPRMISLDGGLTVSDLRPHDEMSPLSCYGQQVSMQYVVRLPSGRHESFSLGVARLESWDPGQGTVELNAAGLLLQAQEDRMLLPMQLPRGLTFGDAVSRIVGDIMPVSIDDALPSRSTPAYTFEEDRLDALQQLLTAWPARAYVDMQGVLQVTVPYDDLTDEIVFEARDGENGTLVSAPSGDTREGRFNGVIATGEAVDDKAPVSGSAYIDEGPMRWGGPYGRVPYGMSSPLLTTNSQCDAAAATRLQNLRRATRPREIEMVPDARIQPGDIGRIHPASDGGEPFLMRVTSRTLPLTYDGTMRISGGVITGRAI